MKALEHLVPPPLVALIVGVAMWGVSRPFAPSAIPGRTWLAAALALAGFAVAFAGFMTFRHAGANIDPHLIDKGDVLVTEGVYRYTRNPMYLGLTLLLLGVAAQLGRPAALLGPVVFVAYITRFQIAAEERAMAMKFGARYAEYVRATRRWF